MILILWIKKNRADTNPLFMLFIDNLIYIYIYNSVIVDIFIRFNAFRYILKKGMKLYEKIFNIFISNVYDNILDC